MKERKRRHDDVHWPMAGKGKRAIPPKSARIGDEPRCDGCGLYPATATHLCDGRLKRTGESQ